MLGIYLHLPVFALPAPSAGWAVLLMSLEQTEGAAGRWLLNFLFITAAEDKAKHRSAGQL